MTDLSPNLSLPYILPSQAQKHVTHNEALATLDALVQAVAKKRDEATPPSAPSEGDCYIVPQGAGTAWGGADHQMAIYDASGWRFITPRQGWRVYVLADRQSLVWDGAAWSADTVNLDQLQGIGIGASYDNTNRLSVSAEASLFSHAGHGHQLKLNKAATADTASLLFQSNWSGRAEMGIAGTDDFAIKVSADGTAWTTALSFDAASGAASGAAVQSSATDTTPGRLMRADYGYGRGNLLGVVSQSGGIPGGAAMERGSNANGEYMRLADGTQICQFELTLNYVNGSICVGNWSFPASFASGSQPQVTGVLSANSMLSTAPGLAPNQITPLMAGGLSAVGAGLQVRTLPGASFASNHSLNARLIAIGRWF